MKIKVILSTISMIGLVTTSAESFAACFTIYDSANQLVYQSPQPPIDLSGSISKEMDSKFPGHHLVITDSINCKPSGDLEAEARAQESGTTAKQLLMDRAAENH
jgi:hypothetical protein